MAGFIVLEDGRAWTVSNEEYDAVLLSIAEAVPQSADGVLFSRWLRWNACGTRWADVGRIDLIELTAAKRALFRDAAQKGFDTAKHDAADAEWLERYEKLLTLLSAVIVDKPRASLRVEAIKLIGVLHTMADELENYQLVTHPGYHRRSGAALQHYADLLEEAVEQHAPREAVLDIMYSVKGIVNWVGQAAVKGDVDTPRGPCWEEYYQFYMIFQETRFSGEVL